MTIEELVKNLLNEPIKDNEDSINKAFENSKLLDEILTIKGVIAVSCPFWWYKDNIEGGWMGKIYHKSNPQYEGAYEKLHDAILAKDLGNFNFLEYYCRNQDSNPPNVLKIKWVGKIRFGYKRKKSNKKLRMPKRGYKRISAKKSIRTYSFLKEISDNIIVFLKSKPRKTNISANSIGSKKLEYLTNYKKTLSSVKHLYFLSAKIMKPEKGKDISAGGFFILSTEPIGNNILERYFSLVNYLYLRISFASMNYRARSEALTAAIQSILIDSYAHNISSHSLNFLQQLFAYRNETYLKKPFSLPHFTKIENLPLNQLAYYDLFNANKANCDDGENLKHYVALGQADKNNSAFESSLLEYMLYGQGCLKNDVSANDLLKYGEGTDDVKIPMPLDYAIAPLLSYLRDRGGFWSGIIRDNKATPSMIVSFYDLLMEMCNNPLFIGTIMAAEEFFIVHVYVNTTKEEDKKKCHLLTINLKEFIDAEMSKKTDKSKNQEEGTPSTGGQNGKSEIREYSFLNDDTYTNLNFVRLGSNHEKLRETLEEIKVLLPGGLVGKQAFFTIVENTLRNAKHINKEDRDAIKQNGLELHFQIENISFNDNDKNEQNSQDDLKILYRIGISLNYCPEKSVNSETEPNNKEKRLLEGVITNSFEPILSAEGKPKMGGSSQDKICAALLFNTTFSAVEDYHKDAERYYPWMFYNLCEDKYNNQIIPHKIYKEESKEEKLKKIKNSISTSNNAQGSYFKNLYIKFFHLWKAKDVKILKEDNNASSQSPNNKMDSFINSIPRYRIGIVPNDETYKNTRKNGVVRIIKSDSIKKEEKLAVAYQAWNTEWLEGDSNSFLKLIMEIGGNLYEFDKEEQQYQLKEFKNRVKSYLNILKIDHDEGAENANVCKLRTHGYFLKYFFGGTLGEVLNKTIFEEKYHELMETIFTNITIVDNRLYNLLDGYRFNDDGELKKDKVLKDNLFLNVFDETQDTYQKVKELYAEDKKRHFYIFHLSYIDDTIPKLNLEGNKGKYEEFIDELFKLKDKDALPDNCIFAVTTGRGRAEWLNQTGRHRANCMHIPIEALQTAIQQSVMFKDDFDIKYNLCKVLFGS